MGLFGNIVNRVLNEVEDKQVLKYEDIKSDYVNGPVYVYHMTGNKEWLGKLLQCLELLWTRYLYLCSSFF